MNYQETLEWIHGLQRFGSRLGLFRMEALMDRLGHPEASLPVIHVGGTNGKGSVCRMLAEILQAHSYRVGLYTSPYLEHFTERIEFDGREISQEELAKYGSQVFEAVEQMLADGLDSPTEFEAVTAIGFLYFQQVPLDFLLLEVGLGGVGDSTNLIKSPLASVITSISFDHMEVLGNTLEEIAEQKAGIIKPGCPVIANVSDPSAASVLRQKAREKGSDFYDVSLIHPTRVWADLDGYGFDTEDYGHVELGMIGRHQVDNALCSLKVIEVLDKRGIIKSDKSLVYRALSKARQKGRMEVLQKDPYLLIDGAHNHAGSLAAARVMKDLFPGQKILLVLGVMADKQIDKMWEAYQDLDADVITTEPDAVKRTDASLLCKKIQGFGGACAPVGDWKQACHYVEREKHRYDVILFTGSIYLIGRIREYYVKRT